MIFSPVNLSSLILLPLRYYFSTYTSSNTAFYWNEDEKKRTIELEYINNLHKITYNERPRVLIDRGSYQVGKTSLTDNMAESQTQAQTLGLKNLTNFIMYQGQASVIIEAVEQGSCEIITDMVQHFLLWTKPYLCNSQGFKDFAYPMTVTSCRLIPQEEGKEKFQNVITVPWMREEIWYVRDDSVKIKNYVLTMTPSQAPITGN
jgi:hypothetical protein